MVDTILLESPDIAVDYGHLVARTVHLMRTSTEPLTLEDLAETAGLSPYHFARVFRSISGVPPVEFQTALRFERAKSLLLTSPASVTEICYEVGYGSLGTFSRRFKQMVGVTPAQFRELPQIVSSMHLQSEVTRRSLPPLGSSARVEGTIEAPNVASHIYIGLFSESLPVSRPVVGQLLLEPGRFLLPDVPIGRYKLMAAALPLAGGPLAHLLPNRDTYVGGGGSVEIRTISDCIERSVTLQPMQPTNAPIVTSLPALLL